MKSMGVSEFKAHALKTLDEVSKTKEPVVITKRGKPVAEVIPYTGGEAKSEAGMLADALVFEKDIVAPLGDDLWDACR